MSVSHLFVTFAQPQFQSYEVETLHAASNHESASLRLAIGELLSDYYRSTLK